MVQPTDNQIISTAKSARPTGLNGLLRRLRQPMRKGAEGQAIVEFVFAFPFLIILVIVLVETGLLLRSHVTTVSAVREGLRIETGRGNADPAYAFDKNNGNSIAQRVGADGDLLLTQNVNTALEGERSNVTMLMTYRADNTEDLTNPLGSKNNITAYPIGQNGLGGAYGIFYNPNVSAYPFMEVFTWTVRSPSAGVSEKWFTPTVMSVSDCKATYAGNPAVDVSGQTTLSGNTYTNKVSGGIFCGDATKKDYSDNVSGGINRKYRLGQYDPATPGSKNDNFASIIGQKQFNSSVACGPGYNPVDGSSYNTKYGMPRTGTLYTAPTPELLRCWRYNFAPWYPSLRYGYDMGDNPSTVASQPGYYNTSGDDSKYFGTDSPGFRSPDYVGVRIDYKHSAFLTANVQFFNFNFTLNLSDRAVKVMDPVGGNFN